MTWAEYYERHDGWQESTQYSRLASIKDLGPDESPSEEICDCIQYVDTRTATSILRRALAAGVRFRGEEVAEIADSGQIEDEEALEKLILTAADAYTGEQLDTLLSCLPDPEPVFELIDTGPHWGLVLERENKMETQVPDPTNTIRRLKWIQNDILKLLKKI